VNYLEARAVVRVLEELYRSNGRPGRTGAQPAPQTAVIALFASQADLLRQLIKQAPALAAHAGAITVGTPGAFRQREADVVVLSLTRSHTHRAVAYGEGPAALHLALTRARRQLVVVGDPGNLARRSHWQGVLDHLDETTATREGQILGQLVRYIHGKGPYQHAFRLSEGSVA
jgi:superfamily I DNA and/or RNA helicase